MPVEPRVRDVVRPFLVAGLLVLIWEILALGHRLRRPRDPASVVSV
jgi:hypothetical protein